MSGENAGGRDSGRHRDAYRDERRDRDRDRERDRGDRRRRSRSPRGGGSRRERDYEVDTYSSSRDYREREREDRYSSRRGEGRGEGRGGEGRGGESRGGEGRGGDDRGWDRDRGGRRDRRDDDRGDRRRDRDRDAYSDRRRGGGRDDREKRKSPTPPPKKKEPTPDLTDVVSVLVKKRRLTQWDIKPPGYDNVTAEQAKLSGMFPLPGAPRQQVMDPSKLQAFMNQPSAAAGAAALKPSNARQSKRLFVSNLPASATDESLLEFFNLQMNGLNVVQGNDPCLSAQIAQDRKYAMVEFRNTEDATLALAFDGQEVEASDASNGASNGASKGVNIQRPQDYIAPSASDDADGEQGVLTNVVNDSPNKISVTQIPVDLTDEQVKELLESFGKLKAFVLVKDIGTEQSRGIAFCEYEEASNTEIAVEGLNGMSLGEHSLKVQRASVGVVQVSGLEMGVNAMSMLAGTQSTDLHDSRVLQLLNMVTADELIDNDEYEEILEDVREECQKYGGVQELKIPRPSGTRTNPGVGKIYVKFEAKDAAAKAMQALAGRKFADRTVVVTYFSEEYFDVNAW